MSMLVTLLVAVGLLAIVGHFYSRFLARTWGVDASQPAPAVALEDGRDYVPTPTPIVFAHHFASIAGAGPIIGPVLALCFGWVPVLLWVVVGGLLIGGLHDFLATYLSVRHRGQSMATMARETLGRGPFVALVLCLIVMLGLVTAVFLNTSATALVNPIALERLRLPAHQTLFRTIRVEGRDCVPIGGMASMSVIVLTACSPLIGWLYLRRCLPVWFCSLLALGICALSIVVGVYCPVTLEPGPWKAALAVYVLVAAGVPVWIFLQSRDFINVHILYAGILALLVGVVVAAARSGGPPPSEALPALDLATGTTKLGVLWPALFITVACGAVSGFHSLCAGGTTAKQLRTVPATRVVGYWAMLLETLLAVCVVFALRLGTSRAAYLGDVFPAGRPHDPIVGFGLAVGVVGHTAFGVPVAVGTIAGMLMLVGFVITTLDTAIRLNRYLIEEVWHALWGEEGRKADGRTGAQKTHASCVSEKGTAPKKQPLSGVRRKLLWLLRAYWFNSGLAVALMVALACSGGVLQLWTIFGTSNQLLASFVLAIGAVWLLRNGRRVWNVALPALFMLVTTVASLIRLLAQFLPRHGPNGRTTGNPTLLVADLVLLGLTAYLVFAAARAMRRAVSSRAEPPRVS